MEGGRFQRPAGSGDADASCSRVPMPRRRRPMRRSATGPARHRAFCTSSGNPGMRRVTRTSATARSTTTRKLVNIDRGGQLVAEPGRPAGRLLQGAEDHRQRSGGQWACTPRRPRWPGRRTSTTCGSRTRRASPCSPTPTSPSEKAGDHMSTPMPDRYVVPLGEGHDGGRRRRLAAAPPLSRRQARARTHAADGGCSHAVWPAGCSARSLVLWAAATLHVLRADAAARKPRHPAAQRVQWPAEELHSCANLPRSTTSTASASPCSPSMSTTSAAWFTATSGPPMSSTSQC